MTDGKNPYYEEAGRLWQLFDRFSCSGEIVVVDGREMRCYEAKAHLIQKYAFAVPTPAAIGAIEKCVRENGLSGVVEMGAGNGYWAHVLSQHGVDVVAYDNFSWYIAQGKNKWFDVQKAGPPVVEKHPDRLLLMVWPPMTTHKAIAGRISRRYKFPKYERNEQLCFEISRRKWAHIRHACGACNMGGATLARFKGEFVAVVGEQGGCTGDEQMWNTLNSDFREVDEAPVMQYSGLHDHLWIYRRTPVCGDRALIPSGTAEAIETERSL